MIQMDCSGWRCLNLFGFNVLPAQFLSAKSPDWNTGRQSLAALLRQKWKINLELMKLLLFIGELWKSLRMLFLLCILTLFLNSLTLSRVPSFLG